MPRALPASARTEPPLTSPPLVAASRRSSVSTLASRRSLDRIYGRNSHPGSPTEDHFRNARSAEADYMEANGTSPHGEAGLRSSSGSAGSRRSFEGPANGSTSGTGTGVGRRGSYRAPGSNRNSGLFDVPDDIDEDADERPRRSYDDDHDRAVSPPPLTSMSLHTVGRKSSVASAASGSSSPSTSSVPLASPYKKMAEFERGHRTMLSSGSVRSIGRRSSVNSAASDVGSAPHSPSIRSTEHLPSLSTALESDAPVDPSPSETPASSSSVTPTSTFSAPFAEPVPRKPNQLPMQKLLEHLLPPGAAEYPHAPGHSTPHAFEEGCSHPPSPRPQNHYRHERDGPEWKPSTLGEEVLNQYSKDELGTPKRGRDGAELSHVTPRRTMEDRELDDQTPRPPSSTAVKTALVPDSPANGQPVPPSPIRPSLPTSTSAPSTTIPRPSTSSSYPGPSLMPSASIASRPPAPALPRNASYNSYGSFGAPMGHRPSIASAIRERRRQASMMAGSGVSASSSMADLGDRGVVESMSDRSLASTASGAEGPGSRGSLPDPSYSPISQNGGPPISPKSFISDGGGGGGGGTGPMQAQQQQATRRIRSRGPTRMGLGDLGPNQDFAQYANGGANRARLADSFARALQQGLEMGMIGDVVMTPTTEVSPLSLDLLPSHVPCHLSDARLPLRRCTTSRPPSFGS